MFVFLLFVPFLMGMGAFGETPANKIPVPDKKYRAEFIDQTDIVTECTDVSIEGNTFVDGKRGEGVFSVSFDRIRSILFRMKDRELRGTIKMKDGNEIELVLSKDRKAYGRTPFGTFQIKLSSLKKITFSSD